MAFLTDKRGLTHDVENKDEENEEFNLEDIYIIQVIQEDVDNKYRQVVGGFHSQKNFDRHLVHFKTLGDYIFKLKNHPANPALCKIKVVDDQNLSFIITEDGFLPKIIRIGNKTITVNA